MDFGAFIMLDSYDSLLMPIYLNTWLNNIIQMCVLNNGITSRKSARNEKLKDTNYKVFRHFGLPMFWPATFWPRMFWPGSIFCLGQSKILVVTYYLVRTFISTHTSTVYSLLNLENTGPKLWVCEILCSYIQWCNKSCMHRKNNNSKINIIQIQYIKV